MSPTVEGWRPWSHGYQEPLCPSALGYFPAAWFLSHLSSSLPVFVYSRPCTDKSVPLLLLELDRSANLTGHAQNQSAPSKPGSRTRMGGHKEHLGKINGETLTLGSNITQGGQGHRLLGSHAVGLVWMV